MNYLIIFLLFALLLGIMFLYLRIADRYHIIDQPNARSSHRIHTIRGGGILFPLALLLGYGYTGFSNGYFVLGLMLISGISFLDDLKNKDPKLRFGIHLVSVSLLFLELDLFNNPWYVVMMALIFVIGSINAINFMDGINGITGAYALITLISLLYLNNNVIHFADNSLLICAAVAVLVFNFFNFRYFARCFAGDVGSVSIAFILLYFILQLVIRSENLSYILLLLIYGLDVVSTILFRIIRKENISEPHRSHFYQYLANEKKVPHLYVASGYAMAQLLVNLIIIYLSVDKISYLALTLVVTGTFFVVFRLMYQGISQLVYKNNAGNP